MHKQWNRLLNTKKIEGLEPEHQYSQHERNIKKATNTYNEIWRTITTKPLTAPQNILLMASSWALKRRTKLRTPEIWYMKELWSKKTSKGFTSFRSASWDGRVARNFHHNKRNPKLDRSTNKNLHGVSDSNKLEEPDFNWSNKCDTSSKTKMFFLPWTPYYILADLS